jgi:hypothetical protein
MSDMPPDFGPAFPSMNDSGLTLRDYFAVAAMTGLCAAGNLAANAHHAGTWANSAQAAYRIADAMLSARLYPMPSD